jgi:hypothetical protein
MKNKIKAALYTLLIISLFVGLVGMLHSDAFVSIIIYGLCICSAIYVTVIIYIVILGNSK